jgi:hypothetical protein
MYRILLFIATIIVPLIFSWWLFLPLAILSVYLSVIPYEIIFAAIILDSFYYFGSGWPLKFPLTIFSVVLLIVAFLLSSRVEWRKRI